MINYANYENDQSSTDINSNTLTGQRKKRGKKKYLFFGYEKWFKKLYTNQKIKSGKMRIWTEATTSKNSVVRTDCKEEAKS